MSSAKGIFLVLVLSGMSVSACLMAQGPNPQAEIILHNGKILTVDERFDIAEAIAIAGNRFSAVGRNSEVLKLAGPGAVIIDLKGRTVVPGLIDTHRHIQMQAESDYAQELDPAGLGRYPVDWRGVRSKDDVLHQIQRLLEKYPFKPGEWIFIEAGQLSVGNAGGLERLKIINDDLNRWELDKVTPRNPVALALGIQEHNEFLVNSKAIEILWRNYGDFIKKYGRYWVDSSGAPDGHLEMPASRLVSHFLPAGSAGALATIYKKHIEELNAMGLTTVATRLSSYSLEAYKLLESRSELRERIAYDNEDIFGTVTDLNKDMRELGKTIGTGSEKLWINSVSPTAADGSSARLCTNQKRISASGNPESKWWPQGQCFNDVEYRGAAGRGAPIRGNYFREWVLNSARYGIRYANTHMSGDRTTATLLGIIEEAQKQMGPAATKGWAFDHCFLVDPAVLKKAAKLGIMFSCYIRTEQAAEIADYYGEKVANEFMSPVKSMLDAGAKVVFESDRDVYDWADLQTFMTRADKQGKVWGPQERVDRVTALKMITRWAAEYVLKSSQLGSIEPGKLADLVVLDRDYMSIPVEEVSKIRPQMTVFDGRIVFVHPNFAAEYNLRPSGAVLQSYEELTKRRSR